MALSIRRARVNQFVLTAVAVLILADAAASMEPSRVIHNRGSLGRKLRPENGSTEMWAIRCWRSFASRLSGRISTVKRAWVIHAII